MWAPSLSQHGKVSSLRNHVKEINQQKTEGTPIRQHNTL